MFWKPLEAFLIHFPQVFIFYFRENVKTKGFLTFLKSVKLNIGMKCFRFETVWYDVKELCTKTFRYVNITEE